MAELAYLFYRPSFAVEKLRTNPRWVLVFLLLAGLNVLFLIHEYPVIMAATLDHLPSSASAGDKAMMKEHLTTDLFARSLFLPVRLLAGWSMFALLLYQVCLSMGPNQPVHYRHFFSLEVHSESILLLGKLAGAALNHGGVPATMPWSLASVVHFPSDVVLTSLLTTLNPFTVWYVAVLGVGTRRFCGFTVVKSVVAVVIVWFVGTACNLGIFEYLVESLHLEL